MPGRFIDSPDLVGKPYAYYDWDIYGNQWLHTQKQAQRAWGMTWPI